MFQSTAEKGFGFFYPAVCVYEDQHVPVGMSHAIVSIGGYRDMFRFRDEDDIGIFSGNLGRASVLLSSVTIIS